jgi:hypothetical protein
MKREASQRNMILEALQAGEHLTAIDALSRFGCFRLGARIWEIRNELGYDVKMKLVETSNGAHVAEYWIETQPQQTRMAI